MFIKKKNQSFLIVGLMMATIVVFTIIIYKER
jgi:hypothetical protein